MKIERNVPLGPALMAACDAMDNLSDGGSDEAFSVWYNEPRINGHNVLHYPALPVATVVDLLPGVPETPAGLAWKASAQACLTLTVDDVNRPYDTLVLDTDTERAAATAIDAFADTLRDTSPLLEDVADVVMRQAPSERFDIDDLLTERARITAEGIVMGHEGYCDKHDQNCYTGDVRVARWQHIHGIHPGAQETITGLLAAFDAHLPVMGEDDRGAARRDRQD